MIELVIDMDTRQCACIYLYIQISFPVTQFHVQSVGGSETPQASKKASTHIHTHFLSLSCHPSAGLSPYTSTSFPPTWPPSLLCPVSQPPSSLFCTQTLRPRTSRLVGPLAFHHLRQLAEAACMGSSPSCSHNDIKGGKRISYTGRARRPA